MSQSAQSPESIIDGQDCPPPHERRSCASRVIVLERDLKHLEDAVQDLDDDLKAGVLDIKATLKTYAPLLRVRALELIVYGAGSILLSKLAENVAAFFLKGPTP